MGGSHPSGLGSLLGLTSIGGRGWHSSLGRGECSYSESIASAKHC
jgi:hypothetical protein